MDTSETAEYRPRPWVHLPSAVLGVSGVALFPVLIAAEVLLFGGRDSQTIPWAVFAAALAVGGLLVVAGLAGSVRCGGWPVVVYLGAIVASSAVFLTLVCAVAFAGIAMHGLPPQD